ncbi:hypothetical protein F4779DRAFT_628293 [Xylariaceae sp. FL0662B]|nr:hypothetical protein F4779DRAFT_628293 [Xylariaceae sp. FL0662B]
MTPLHSPNDNVNDVEQHRKDCRGPREKPRKQCRKCRQYFDKNKIEEHVQACEYWLCRHCSTVTLAAERDEHSKICQKWQCGICWQRMKASERHEHLPNSKDEHIQSCEFWSCRACLLVVFKTEREAHLQKCDRWCCGRCYMSMLKSERDQHLQNCEYWKCSRCNKLYPTSMRYEHKVACLEARPARCNYCRKTGQHKEISQHEAECDTRMCPGCKRAIKVDTITAHWAKCTKMVCSSCSCVVERNGSHNCPKQLCPICLRRFSRGCQDEHLRECEGYKKVDSLHSKKESDRATRSILSQNFRFPLFEGCAKTLTTFLKHPHNTFIIYFECIFSDDGPLPLQVAIFDALERQVVPPTVIDHKMTVGELRQKISFSKFHQARGPFASVGVIQRFQPGREEDRMIGLTCHAIADLMRKHINISATFAFSIAFFYLLFTRLTCLLLPRNMDPWKSALLGQGLKSIFDA